MITDTLYSTSWVWVSGGAGGMECNNDRLYELYRVLGNFRGTKFFADAEFQIRGSYIGFYISSIQFNSIQFNSIKLYNHIYVDVIKS